MSGKTGLANIITGARLLCSFVLLICPVFSLPFYILYILAGFTDMIDGAVARTTGTVSAFGAKFDTIADFVFVVVCLIKLLPVLAVPSWLWVWIWVIALIRAVNIVSGYVKQKRLVVLHTVMNKAAGALLFLLPLTLPYIGLPYSAAIVCSVASFAAVQEGHYIRTGREKQEAKL